MLFNKKENIKYKLLTLDELIISLDRISRFKEPDESYNRVFNLILYKCLISPKLSKTDLESLTKEKLSKYVQIIWNSSVESIFHGGKYTTRHRRRGRKNTACLPDAFPLSFRLVALSLPYHRRTLSLP